MQRSVIHTIQPVYDTDSKILILGSIPSPKSREIGFFYGHPQNRFWRIMTNLLNEAYPVSIQDKQKLLLRNHIALWDVLASCEIDGADDSSIQKPVPNPIERILTGSKIEAVFTTGKKALSLYQKLCFPTTDRTAISLPSPSPANCRVPFDEICTAYQVILPYLKTEPSGKE
ncbi:MAG: DNA-deoxyinosine glycosylase [Flexilinea sp.]